MAGRFHVLLRATTVTSAALRSAVSGPAGNVWFAVLRLRPARKVVPSWRPQRAVSRRDKCSNTYSPAEAVPTLNRVSTDSRLDEVR